MADKDFAISPVAVPQVGALNKKPAYLIHFKSENKNSTMAPFLTIDKPELLEGFVQVKGFCVIGKEDSVIISSLNELLLETPKDNYKEMMFPFHMIKSMQSLSFRAK